MTTSVTSTPSKSCPVGMPSSHSLPYVECVPATFTSVKDGLEHSNGDKGGATHAGIKPSESDLESAAFVNTFDEFEPYEELDPVPWNSMGEHVRDSHLFGDRDSEDTSDCGEKGDGGEGRESVESASAGGREQRSQNIGLSQLPGASRGPRDAVGATYAAIGADQRACQPAWACGPGQFFSYTMGSSQAPVMMMAPPQGLPLAGNHGVSQRPPAACPAQPPGSWFPAQKQTAAPSAPAGAASVPQEAAGRSVCLVKAASPPAPLHHGKRAPVTSLTMNHLPFQMRRTQLCNLLDELGFLGHYDYLYVPCHHDKTNRGHAFINFCTPNDAKDFFSMWHGARITGVGTDAPVLSIAVSVVQGFEASIKRWTVARMLGLKDPDFRPFIAGMN